MSTSNRVTKTVGVIGGMGPMATVDFYRRIVEATDADRDQDHLHVIIDADPSVPDRTAFVLGDGEDPAPIVTASARRLEAAGAELLVVACNTAHVVAETVRRSVRVPLVDWTDEAAATLVELRPGVGAVGLLATDGTIAARLYHKVFESRGVRVLVPDEAAQRVVMDVIYREGGVKAGGSPVDLERHREALQQVAEQLAAAGAEVLLLACTDLSVLDAAVPRRWPVRVFDAADLVARRVVERAGAPLRHPLGAATAEARTAGGTSAPGRRQP